MTIKDEVRALWEACFEDPEAFVDLYFDRRYSDDANIAIRKDGRLVAALQTIPYEMTFCHAVVPVSYVSGACTHPAYRKQGLMRKLLKKAHRKMRENEAWFSVLIPAEEWLFRYYRASGYASVFRFDAEKLDLNVFLNDDACSDRKNDYRMECARGNREVYAYLNRGWRSRNCWVQHSYEDFLDITADLFLDKGVLLVAKRDERIVGAAIAVHKGDDLVLKELLFDDERTKTVLLSGIALHFETFSALWIKPGASYRHGMARLLDVEKVYSAYAENHPEEHLTFFIDDDQDLPENNGLYEIHDGKLSHDRNIGREAFPFTIEKATAYLFRAYLPYMSLMMD